MDRAKLKNLEATKGNDSDNPFPTVLNSTAFTLQQIATQLGVNIGNSAVDIDNNLQIIKGLEEARTALYMSGLRTSNEVIQ